VMAGRRGRRTRGSSSCPGAAGPPGLVALSGRRRRGMIRA
jgi:hypothetical protein